jgi:peptidoglycan-N-acetylglucosamine deacetylase
MRRRTAAVTALAVAGLLVTAIVLATSGGDGPNPARRTASGVTATGSPSATAEPGASPDPAPAGPTASPTRGPTRSTSPRPRTPGPTRASSRPPTYRGGGGSGPGGSARTTGSSAVALTFDDGPDPDNTPHLLDLLAQYHVKATFCLVGWRARDNPAIVARIAADGHSFCNHSWQHLFDLAQRTDSYIRWDLTQTNQAIRAAVPGAQIKYFRAPGGNFTARLVDLARQYGMSSIYWDVDPRDWDHSHDASDQTHIDRVISAVEQATRPGSIVLSHDNKQPDTIIAYATLIPWLKQRFTLVALT